MKRQAVIDDVGITLRAGDVDHGVELENAAAHFEHVHAGAVVGLPAHQARHPHVEVGLDRLQRLDLVDRAAEVGILFPSLVVKRELVLPVFGLDVEHFQAIFLREFVAVDDGFEEVVAGVDEGDFLPRFDAMNDVQKICRGGGKRRRDKHLAGVKLAVEQPEPRFEIQRRVACVEIGDVRVVKVRTGRLGRGGRECAGGGVKQCSVHAQKYKGDIRHSQST